MTAFTGDLRMSFKNKFTGFSLIVSSILSSSSCGLLGESVANFSSNGSNISSGAGCMRDSVETLSKYFTGEAGQIAVNGAWACVDESLDLFGKKVRGENPGYYQARELASFIEGQILDPGIRLSDSLILEIMHLKQIMVGGTSDKLTIAELTELREFVKKIKTLFFEIQPSMKVITRNWNPESLTRAEIKSKLSETEQTFATNLNRHWPVVKATYNLQNLQTLADALLDNFPSSPGLASFHRWVTDCLQLVVATKKSILNTDNSLVAAQDWPRLLSVLPHLYSRFLFYDYLLSGKTLLWGENLNDFNQWVKDISGNLTQVFITRGGGTAIGISVGEINALVDGLQTAQVLTDFLKPELIKSLVPLAISRFFISPSSRLAGRKETSLGPLVLEAFNIELDVFIAAQTKLNELWLRKSTWTHMELRAAFQGLTGGPEEISRILQSPNSFAFDTRSRMHIDAGQEIPYDQESALKLNLSRTFARLFIRSYSNDLSRANNSASLTKEEVLIAAFNELRPSLVQAGLIEADNEKFASNRFREANLFTPVGNGDAVLDFKEASAIALMVWSGINLSKEFEPQILAGCKVASSNPVVINVPCALDLFRTQVPALASNIPLMALNIQNMNSTEATQMLLETLRATGWDVNANNTAKLSDLGLVPHLLQYMETIYRRWDTNKDKVLNKAEAMIAEPVFRPLLAEISGQTNVSVLRAGFAYVLVHQQNPSDDFFKFLLFMNDEASWTINVDRPKLSKVLGFIADEMAKP